MVVFSSDALQEAVLADSFALGACEPPEGSYERSGIADSRERVKPLSARPPNRECEGSPPQAHANPIRVEVGDPGYV